MSEITNATPKARFLESGDNITKHRKMVDSGEFQRACDFAMLQYTGGISGEITDGTTAMAVGLKLLGAQQFLQVLRNLSEAPKAPSNIVPVGLNHRT